MIIYNVTIKVASDIVKEWLNWMQEKHLGDMMNTGKFLGYRMCALENITDEDDSQTFVIQYECEDMHAYEAYILNDSEAMRQDGLSKFGDRFIAFRTIMEVIQKG